MSAAVSPSTNAPIWWSNATFFLSVHVASLVGVYYRPLWSRPWQTRLLCFLSWQFAVFGITIGYHRLYSHRSFTARRPLRIILALMGCLGFQGSIKWWCARHRLHHRYTDTVHDPYDATKGLVYSHVGWIFRKPQYPRLALIDRSDLDRDPVVKFQHKYYLPLTLGLGFLLPALLALGWNDALGGFVYGGIVARLMIWHCTFIVNSFAHWDGLQPYSDEVTARGNLFMALLTGGEGNHNYHAFPHDFRAGPNVFDWDPSKWIIMLLHKYTNLIGSFKVANEQDVEWAKANMFHKGHSHGHGHDYDADTLEHSYTLHDEDKEASTIQKDDVQSWDLEQVQVYVRREMKSVVFIDGWIVDITAYRHEHPGGYAVLSPYVFRPCASKNSSGTQATSLSPTLRDASWAFNGGLNRHTQAAKRRMRMMRVARVSESLMKEMELEGME